MSNGIVRRLVAIYAAARRPGPYRDLNERFAREELSGLSYMFWDRLLVLSLLSVWVALTLPFERSGGYITYITPSPPLLYLAPCPTSSRGVASVERQ
jgi:hypothetical protein